MPQLAKTQRVALVFLSVGAFFGGSAAILIRLCRFPAPAVASLRMLLAGILLLPFCLGELRRTWRERGLAGCLPLLVPGVVSAALLAFTLSIDDFVISFFTSGPSSVTLPIYIFGSLRRGITPEIHALSTVIFLVTVLLVVALQLTMRNPKEE